MKLITAWSEITTQNLVLKILLGLSGVVMLGLVVTIARLAMKPPLLIERSCVSKTLKTSSTKHTEEEIIAFLKLAIAERFNSFEKARNFVSEKEWNFKTQEQKELEHRQISQKVIVNEVKVSKDEIVLDTDRLISVGSVRSAFVFPLSAKIESTYRSEQNPYGLILTKISPLKREESKNEK